VNDGLRIAGERLRRFERLGGVDLSRLYPEERDPLEAHIHVGTANLKKAIFTFRCELCGRVERSDQEMPPACTGPSWTDDHPLEPMIREP
jgi:hypothetical protein